MPAIRVTSERHQEVRNIARHIVSCAKGFFFLSFSFSCDDPIVENPGKGVGGGQKKYKMYKQPSLHLRVYLTLDFVQGKKREDRVAVYDTTPKAKKGKPILANQI